MIRELTKYVYECNLCRFQLPSDELPEHWKEIDVDLTAEQAEEEGSDYRRVHICGTCGATLKAVYAVEAAL